MTTEVSDSVKKIDDIVKEVVNDVLPVIPVDKVVDKINLVEDISINAVICNWSTYKGTHCRRNILPTKCPGKINFCAMHVILIKDFTRMSDPGILCDTFADIKLVPRSYAHIKSVMKEISNEDNIVDVFCGGSSERAKITKNYILILSDSSKYYYTDHKSNEGNYKARNLKLLLKKYCDGISVIKYNEVQYCEECYKKTKTLPKISLIN
jgi:hypothetical protein